MGVPDALCAARRFSRANGSAPSGRENHSGIQPRALPWAITFRPFRAALACGLTSRGCPGFTLADSPSPGPCSMSGWRSSRNLNSTGLGANASAPNPGPVAVPVHPPGWAGGGRRLQCADLRTVGVPDSRCQIPSAPSANGSAPSGRENHWASNPGRCPGLSHSALSGRL